MKVKNLLFHNLKDSLYKTSRKKGEYVYLEFHNENFESGS